MAALVSAFSPTALLRGDHSSTGLVATWIHLGSGFALNETPYGRTLLIKLAVLAIVADTCAYN